MTELASVRGICVHGAFPFGSSSMGLFDICKRSRAAGASCSDPREILLRQVELALHAEERIREVEADPEHFAVKVKVGETAFILHLDNLFADSREFSPEDRRFLRSRRRRC